MVNDLRYDAIRARIENSTEQVRPALRRRQYETPPEQKSAVCDIHGEYVFGVCEWPMGGWAVHSVCTKCVQERQDKIDKEAFERYERETKSRVYDKLTSAGVSARNVEKQFDSYIADTEDKKKALSAATDYANSVCGYGKGFNLILVGTTGTGKTHLANAITNHCILSGKTCATVQLKNLISEYRASWTDRASLSSTEVIEKYGSMKGLVIDEIGLDDVTQNESVIIFELINKRYDNMLTTAFVSNLNANGLKEVLGDRVSDRIKEDNPRFVIMNWESARGKL